MGNCLGFFEFKATPDRLKGFHHTRSLLFDNRPSMRPPRSNMQTAHRPSIRTRQDTVLDEPMEDVKLHYEMGNELGRGQFGLIRFCKSKQTGEKFACKSIAKGRLRTQRDMDFVRTEIAIMKELKGHPKIVELKAVYEDTTWVHLVMELCEGGELFNKIDQEKPYPEKDAAEICKSLMEAMQYCHSHGIIHRDLKPENILLVSKTCPSQIKVADFGLAMNVQPGVKTSRIAGTAYYIAPEVLKGEYGTEVDVWSSGVILYILLCGVPPFWGTTEQGIFEAIRHDRLDLQSDPWPKISSAAKDLIRGMLCPDIKKRFTPENILSHKWIVNQTQILKSDQSSSLQQDNLLSHTLSCFDTSSYPSYSDVSEDFSLANMSCRNDMSISSSLGVSSIHSPEAVTQISATAAQERCKTEDGEYNPASDEDGLLSEIWTSFIRLVEQILHEFSGACVKKAHKDMPSIYTIISRLQAKKGFNCTLLEATSLTETAIVDLGKEKHSLVLRK